jgi:plastocyanin
VEKTLFYIFGCVLFCSALGVGVLGLRFPNFPPSRAALRGLVAYFAALVAATTTFAVLQATASDERQHNQEASAQIEQGQTAAAAPTGGATTAQASSGGATAGGGAAGGGGGQALKLSSPSSGQPAYDTNQLTAKPGKVTIGFDNPSPVQHDVAIAQGSKELAKSDLISGGSTSVSTTLKPGKYTYYCTVPGHREAGMEGTLTVK